MAEHHLPPAANLLCDVKNLVKHGEVRPYLWVDGAYWSLLVELRFYLLLWLLAYVLRIRRPGIAIALMAFGAAGNFAPSFVSKSADFLLYLSFFAFGMGVREIRDGQRIGYLTSGLSLASFISNCLFGSTALSMTLNSGNMMGYLACFAVFAGVVFLLPGAKNRFLGWAGMLTYPAYLLHQDLGLMGLSALVPIFGHVASAGLVILSVVACAILVQALDRRISPHLRSGIGVALLFGRNAGHRITMARGRQ